MENDDVFRFLSTQRVNSMEILSAKTDVFASSHERCLPWFRLMYVMIQGQMMSLCAPTRSCPR